MKLKLAAVALMISATMCCSQTTEGFELLDRMLNRGGCGCASSCCDTPVSACGGRTFGISLKITLPGRGLFGGGCGGGCFDNCGGGCDTCYDNCYDGGCGGGLLSGGCGGGLLGGGCRGGLLGGGCGGGLLGGDCGGCGGAYYGATGDCCGNNNCMPVCNDSCGGGLLSGGLFSGWGCRGGLLNRGCGGGCFDGGCDTGCGCGGNYFDHGCNGCADANCGCGGGLLNGCRRGRVQNFNCGCVDNTCGCRSGINLRGRLCDRLCGGGCGGGCYQSCGCDTGCDAGCGGCYDGCGGRNILGNVRGRLSSLCLLDRVKGRFSCGGGCCDDCYNSGCGCQGDMMQQPVMDSAQPMMNTVEPTPAQGAPAAGAAVDPGAGAYNVLKPVVDPSAFIIPGGQIQN